MPRGSKRKEDDQSPSPDFPSDGSAPAAADVPDDDPGTALPDGEALLAAEEGEDEGATEKTELLGFMISDEEYALDILEIKEIIRLQTITPVPRTPDYLKGIITLRGVIVPIFDLRCRLGLKEREHGPLTRIIVVYRGEEYAGLIVDSITQVMRIGAEQIEPPPTTIGVVEAEFIRGVTRHQERLVILLNLSRVLDVTA
jgi:purine-binding chemotaxis protein CheW